MERLHTLLYIKPSNSSFILTDQILLEKHFNIKSYLVNTSGNKLRFSYNLFTLAWFLLKHSSNSTAFVCWFGDYHAAVMVFMGRLLHKKTIIFAGGQEAICYKELGKGVYLKKFRGACVKYALRNASLIVPNHVSLIYHENYFYNPENPHIDGIKHYVHGIKGDIIVIPNGIDFSRINRNPEIEKVPNLILTVGTMNKISDFYNKGFDLFIRLSRLHPDKEFVLIGVKGSFLDWIEENFKVSSITNLKIIPSYCPDHILAEYYNKAKIYIQVSITEGMPVSLGEAMLCECVPVGSNVNGIPDAIGNTGVIIYERDIVELSKALEKAFVMITGAEARKHTMENFSIKQREEKMIAAIVSVLE